jgi:GNAT superfamily N-acetyltransferase
MTFLNKDIQVIELAAIHVDSIVEAFANANWPKAAELFYEYIEQQKDSLLYAWVALYQDNIAGYVTLNLRSKYSYFAQNNIPEIMDLNVLPQYRGLRIGSKLLLAAENKGFLFSKKVGLGVGLYADYGIAIQMYFRYGYCPDGKGITYQHAFCKPGDYVQLDDDLNIWLLKELSDASK